MIADAILDALREGVFAVDVDRRVVYWNHRMEELTGVPRHDVVGTIVYDRFPSWRESGDALIASALAGNFGAAADFPIVAQPDCRFEATFKSIPDAVVVVLRDITQTALIREQLRETDVRFQIMADTSPVLLWMSGTDGLCNFFNQRWLEFTGRTLEMELGNGWAEGVHHEDFQRCMDTYLDAFVAHRAFRMEYRLRRADGRYRWLLDTGVPRFAPSGTFAGFIGSCIDITDSKLARDELDRLVRERTAELESFAYSVSHDLRAPLRAIDGFSHALLEDNAAQLDAAGQDHLRRVREAAQRMSSLIDDLLQLSRIGRADLASVPCDLGTITDEIIASLREREPSRDITVTVQRGLVVRGDPRLLRIALDNLVGNAWKFTARTARPTIELDSIQHDGQPAYVVRDNGAGFDMRYAQKLFAPFQRLHGVDEFAGTGIGLATVKRIIARHGGQVWAESKPAEGASFYFTVPERPVAD
jgi:PAS domain S-box-containing protein